MAGWLVPPNVAGTGIRLAGKLGNPGGEPEDTSTAKADFIPNSGRVTYYFKPERAGSLPSQRQARFLCRSTRRFEQYRYWPTSPKGALSGHADRNRGKFALREFPG